MILTTFILMISFSGKKMSDEEVIKRAEELGMVMKEEEPLFSSESQMVEQTESQIAEQEESTELIQQTMAILPVDLLWKFQQEKSHFLYLI